MILGTCVRTKKIDRTLVVGSFQSWMHHFLPGCQSTGKNQTKSIVFLKFNRRQIAEGTTSHTKQKCKSVTETQKHLELFNFNGPKQTKAGPACGDIN